MVVTDPVVVVVEAVVVVVEAVVVVVGALVDVVGEEVVVVVPGRLVVGVADFVESSRRPGSCWITTSSAAAAGKQHVGSPGGDVGTDRRHRHGHERTGREAVELGRQAHHETPADGLVDRKICDRRVDEVVQGERIGDLGVQLVDHRPEEGLLIADPREVTAVVRVPDAIHLVLKVPAAHQGEGLGAVHELAARHFDAQAWIDARL